jgi:transcriptional regulator with XRE-family HTH domain
MALEVWRQNLVILRENLGKTQSELASYLKKSQQAIGMWEKGKGEPNIEEIELLTRFFGISAHDFLFVVQPIEKLPSTKKRKNVQGNVQGNVQLKLKNKQYQHYEPVLNMAAEEDIKLIAKPEVNLEQRMSILSGLLAKMNERVRAVEEELLKLNQKDV